MRVFNRYLVILAVVSAVINVTLAIFKQNDLSVYFMLNIIAYLVITLLHVYFTPKARSALNGVTVVLFSGFLVIIAVKVFEILSK
ncbi:MAG: hypothetical protein PHE50_04405 [Dehalococcoidales bacterium]|nr:hypothetical protein [Dehalococcoidales bacterium]